MIEAFFGGMIFVAWIGMLLRTQARAVTVVCAALFLISVYWCGGMFGADDPAWPGYIGLVGSIALFVWDQAKNA